MGYFIMPYAKGRETEYVLYRHRPRDFVRYVTCAATLDTVAGALTTTKLSENYHILSKRNYRGISGKTFETPSTLRYAILFYSGIIPISLKKVLKFYSSLFSQPTTNDGERILPLPFGGLCNSLEDRFRITRAPSKSHRWGHPKWRVFSAERD